jgi:hypothetical protein
MGKLSLRLAGGLASIGSLLVSAGAIGQPAPTTNYASFNVVPGKTVQVGFFGSASKKDCAPARAPTIRVIEPPKAGSLMLRHGEVDADKMGSCAPFRVPVQVMLYTAGRNDADADRLVYEVTSANGQVDTYQITINIKNGPARGPTIQKPEQKS